jgi:hypothetical protein
VYVILSINRNVHVPSSNDAQVRELLERIEKARCLVELPLSNKTFEQRELTSYIKMDLRSSLQRSITDSTIATLTNDIYQQFDQQPQMIYLLRLILYKYDMFQSSKTFDFAHITIDEVIHMYTSKSTEHKQTVCSRSFVLDHCESKFGTKICAYIFNYISSSQSAISELELLDILSCNNEFYLEYFHHDLPKHLRFPPSLWIAVKHSLGTTSQFHFEYVESCNGTLYTRSC